MNMVFQSKIMIMKKILIQLSVKPLISDRLQKS